MKNIKSPFTARVSTGRECWSIDNGMAAGGCKPGSLCRPWLPDGGIWDGRSPWYCLASLELASGELLRKLPPAAQALFVPHHSDNVHK